MTENDYIAEYVKERCPGLLNTVDYNLWKLSKAASEAVQTIVDSIKAIDWSKVPSDDLVKEQQEDNEDQGRKLKNEQSEEPSSSEKPNRSIEEKCPCYHCEYFEIKGWSHCKIHEDAYGDSRCNDYHKVSQVLVKAEVEPQESEKV